MMTRNWRRGALVLAIATTGLAGCSGFGTKIIASSIDAYARTAAKNMVAATPTQQGTVYDQYTAAVPPANTNVGVGVGVGGSNVSGLGALQGYVMCFDGTTNVGVNSDPPILIGVKIDNGKDSVYYSQPLNTTTGKFQFGNLKAGTYAVKISRIKFDDVNLTVTILPGLVTSYTVLPEQVAGLETDPAWSGNSLPGAKNLFPVIVMHKSAVVATTGAVVLTVVNKDGSLNTKALVGIGDGNNANIQAAPVNSSGNATFLGLKANNADGSPHYWVAEGIYKDASGTVHTGYKGVRIWPGTSTNAQIVLD